MSFSMRDSAFRRSIADSLHGLVMQRKLNTRALLTDRAGGAYGDEPAAAATAAAGIVLCASRQHFLLLGAGFGFRAMSPAGRIGKGR